MRPKSSWPKTTAEKVVKDIRRKTRRHFSAEDKIRVVLEGLRGDASSLASCPRHEACRRHCRAMPAGRHCPGRLLQMVEDFMEAGKRRLAGDTARGANSDEVRELRKEARDLKEVVAEQMLEMRLLKKSMLGNGGDEE